MIVFYFHHRYFCIQYSYYSKYYLLFLVYNNCLLLFHNQKILNIFKYCIFTFFSPFHDMKTWEKQRFFGIFKGCWKRLWHERFLISKKIFLSLKRFLISLVAVSFCDIFSVKKFFLSLIMFPSLRFSIIICYENNN